MPMKPAWPGERGDGPLFSDFFHWDWALQVWSYIYEIGGRIAETAFRYEFRLIALLVEYLRHLLHIRYGTEAPVADAARAEYLLELRVQVRAVFDSADLFFPSVTRYE